MRCDRYLLSVLPLPSTKAFTQNREEGYPQSRTKANQDIISFSKYLTCFPQIAPLLPAMGPEILPVEISSSLLRHGISPHYVNLGNSFNL